MYRLSQILIGLCALLLCCSTFCFIRPVTAQTDFTGCWDMGSSNQNGDGTLRSTILNDFILSEETNVDTPLFAV